MIEMNGVLYPSEMVIVRFEGARTSGGGRGDVLIVRSVVTGEIIDRHVTGGKFDAKETYLRLLGEVVGFRSLFRPPADGSQKPLYRDLEGRGWYPIDAAPIGGEPIMLRDQAGTETPARWHPDGYWADADDRMILGQPGIWAWSPAPPENTEGYE